MMTPFRKYGFEHGLDTLALLVVMTATIVGCSFYVGHSIDKAMRQLVIENSNDTQLLLGLQRVHQDGAAATNARLDALKDRLKLMEERQEINDLKTDMIKPNNPNVGPEKKWDTKQTPKQTPKN